MQPISSNEFLNSFPETQSIQISSVIKEEKKPNSMLQLEVPSSIFDKSDFKFSNTFQILSHLDVPSVFDHPNFLIPERRSLGPQIFAWSNLQSDPNDLLSSFILAYQFEGENYFSRFKSELSQLVNRQIRSVEENSHNFHNPYFDVTMTDKEVLNETMKPYSRNLDYICSSYFAEIDFFKKSEVYLLYRLRIYIEIKHPKLCLFIRYSPQNKDRTRLCSFNEAKEIVAYIFVFYLLLTRNKILLENCTQKWFEGEDITVRTIYKWYVYVMNTCCHTMRKIIKAF